MVGVGSPNPLKRRGDVFKRRWLYLDDDDRGPIPGSCTGCVGAGLDGGADQDVADAVMSGCEGQVLASRLPDSLPGPAAPGSAEFSEVRGQRGIQDDRIPSLEELAALDPRTYVLGRRGPFEDQLAAKPADPDIRATVHWPIVGDGGAYANGTTRTVEKRRQATQLT
jgi:hypothetical protein